MIQSPFLCLANFSGLALFAIFDAASLDSWGKLIVVVGIPSVCTLIFVLVGVRRSEKNSTAADDRETRMADRINHLEDIIREDYVGIINENHQLLSKVVNALSDVTNTLKEVHVAVEKNSEITNEVLNQLSVGRCVPMDQKPEQE